MPCIQNSASTVSLFSQKPLSTDVVVLKSFLFRRTCGQRGWVGRPQQSIRPRIWSWYGTF